MRWQADSSVIAPTMALPARPLEVFSDSKPDLTQSIFRVYRIQNHNQSYKVGNGIQCHSLDQILQTSHILLASEASHANLV